MNEPANSLETALADRYVVERELGAGGMATVYLARGLKFDRFVALKVLRPELAAVLGKERFGDGPGTLVPLAGRLHYQGRYLG
jgi:serine/threonine-protein kinase